MLKVVSASLDINIREGNRNDSVLAYVITRS
jgi:hypothetical protein